MLNLCRIFGITRSRTDVTAITRKLIILDCTGYNVFRLDGDNCLVSKEKARKNAAKSDNLVPVYSASFSDAEEG